MPKSEKTKQVYIFKELICNNCKSLLDHAFGPISKRYICCFCGEARDDEKDKGIE